MSGEAQVARVTLLCHCGERFQLHDLDPAYAHVRAEHGSDELAAHLVPELTWPRHD